MRRLVFALLVFLLLPVAGAQAAPPDGWPTVEEQLAKDKVVPGSPLEKLVRENQNFGLLRAEERFDKMPVPPWLRVWWRKNHPEGRYLPTDPMGGYPHVLKEIHEWMVSHQELAPGHAKLAFGGSLDSLTEDATAGLNLRISGAQTSRRSESDIRVNYWDPTKIIGASNNIGGSGQQAQFYSTNGGATWGQNYLPLASGDAFHSDPTVDWTSDGTAWATTIGINSAGSVLKMQSYKSTNSGATWTFDATVSGSQTTPTSRSCGSTTAPRRPSRTTSTSSGTTAPRRS